MKRCVIATRDPWIWIDKFPDHSIMIINPDAPESRYYYLLANSDYSLLVTDEGVTERDGHDYPNEKMFWYTSGTTGDSKFYSFTQSQIDHVSQTMIDAYQLTANDRYLGVMPMWHAHGLGIYLATKRSGCETEFVNPVHLRSKIQFSPTFLSAIPDLLKLFTRQPFRDLRFIRSASSPLSLQMYDQLRSHWKVPVVEAFGMTEAGSHCFTNPLNGEQRPGTVGLPSGIQASIIDGHLHIKGPGLYQPGWFDTGDLAEQDSAGYYKILGRATDRLNIKGYKIDPLSIEQQLYNCLSGLDQIYVFGTNRLKCVYSGQCSKQTVRQTLINIDVKCNPVLLERLESIPVNDAGKVSRTYLDKLFY